MHALQTSFSFGSIAGTASSISIGALASIVPTVLLSFSTTPNSLGFGSFVLNHSPLNALMSQLANSVDLLACAQSTRRWGLKKCYSLSYTIVLALWKDIEWSLSGNIWTS